jgi:hypothetical protein
MDNVTRLPIAANDPPPVQADPFLCLVEVHVQKALTPVESRALAMVLLEAADEAEGNEELGGFGYSEHDSVLLGTLYSAIDEHLGWDDDEQEMSQDYYGRVVQVGAILKRRGLRLVTP